MKCHLVFLLTLGLVIADPILKQTISADNNHAPPSEYSESEIKQNANFNKADSEQKNEDINATLESIIGSEIERDPNVQVIIEEAIDLPYDLVPPPESEDVILNDNGLSLADDLYPNEIIEKHPDEIMDTASGFAPLPFLRRRQKPRRRFATRRHSQRNPYRRVFYYYPYYPYYYPSSLRYY